MIKTFVVNLAHSTERKKYMETLLKNVSIEYEFFPAVYGKEIKNLDEVYDKERALKARKHELTVGEIGCALSHRAIYKKMIDENIRQALILEDDIEILPHFFEVYKALSSFDVGNKIILLGTNATKRKKMIWKKKLTDTHSMYLVLNSYAGTYGYVIGLKAAKKIYEHSDKVFLTADEWKYYRRLSQIWLVSPSIVKSTDALFGSIVNPK